jgi:hypothetical protein
MNFVFVTFNCDMTETRGLRLRLRCEQKLKNNSTLSVLFSSFSVLFDYFIFLDVTSEC